MIADLERATNNNIEHQGIGVRTNEHSAGNDCRKT